MFVKDFHVSNIAYWYIKHRLHSIETHKICRSKDMER